ncbi:MAG TPA: CRISPR-associated protein Cas4 [Eubacteriales bacterium]|nr:CRISPR-associated protein Cas4 [Clostridia bacterium]HRV73507.1 CRISPR-associated protein Cas4 [Eubacteriales bacterium]
MPEDNEYLPLSWLSQAAYCLRRAALLLNERVWVENADTAKGRAEHENVHNQRIERRGEQIKLYEYAVFSSILRLSGKCDCIEAVKALDGCNIPAVDFPVRLYPIEYKHGSVREETEYEIQLCAQAMCLEEMYHTDISEGAIFYLSSHRRLQVIFTDTLRRQVIDTAQALWVVRDTLSVPRPQESAKCKRCSLNSYCMPDASSSAKVYCLRLAKEAKGGDEL